MALLEVEKVVAVTMLEAVKATMEQVGSQRMELADRGVDSRELVTVYGDLRRLKDYLQRSIGAFRDRVELDFAPVDLTLLCACCRRTAELADGRLGMCTDPRERSLVEQKRDMLVQWAVELATPPLLELQLPPVVAAATSPSIRAMRARISKKIAVTTLAAGPNPYVDQLLPMHSDLAGPEPAGEASQLVKSSAMLQPSFGMAGGREEVRLSNPGSPFAVPKPCLPDHVSMPPGSERQMESAVAAAADSGRLIDANGVRDPRLRAILALDLRAFERALTVHDYRAAAVHLTSVVEAAVLDHALPRALELGLSGPPDTWEPQDVLLRILGETCQPRDRAAAFYLFAAANLVHPAQQLRMPIVMTAAALRKNMEFAQVALRAMGFTT